jgi:hypothetical protein
MAGIAISTIAESLGLVTTMSPTAPTTSTALRKARETLTPKADLTWVASAVSRETISPLLAASKKAGSSWVRRPNTAARRSATTRSPSVTTK